MSARPQHIQALENGNVRRLRIAEAKRQIKARELSLTEAFSDPSLETMRVCDLFEAVRGLTPRKVGSLLLAAEIGYARPLGRLTTRDKWALMRLLNAYHKGVRLHPKDRRNNANVRSLIAAQNGKVPRTIKNGAAPRKRPAPGHEGVSSVSRTSLSDGLGR